MSVSLFATPIAENIANQWFVEPTYCTSLLLGVERFHGLTHDPSCGQGNIVKTLRAAGVHAIGTDLVQRVPDGTSWFGGCYDFMNWTPGLLPENVVCNPPFYRAKGTEAFARKALSIARSKVAVFTELRFLASDGRANGLYQELPPDRIWIISPRPSCPPGQFLLDGGKDEDGKADWCWLVWDKTLPEPMRGQTRIAWLRGESRRKKLTADGPQ